MMQEEKMVPLLGAGTLSILVIIICLVGAILTRPKSAPAATSSQNSVSSAPVAVETVSTQANQTETSSQNEPAIEPSGTVAGTSTGKTYTVQAGDTLYGIATQFNVSWQEIAKANNISDPGSLHEGQEIKIP